MKMSCEQEVGDAIYGSEKLCWFCCPVAQTLHWTRIVWHTLVNWKEGKQNLNFGRAKFGRSETKQQRNQARGSCKCRAPEVAEKSLQNTEQIPLLVWTSLDKSGWMITWPILYILLLIWKLVGCFLFAWIEANVMNQRKYLWLILQCVFEVTEEFYLKFMWKFTESWSWNSTRAEAKNDCAGEDHQHFNRPTDWGEGMMNPITDCRRNKTMG
jgi:hypothetical protein